MKDAFAELLKSNLLKAITGLTGWRAWLAKLAIKFLVKLVGIFAKYLEVKKEVKKDLEKYKKVINDPNSSADDIRDAAPDFLK